MRTRHSLETQPVWVEADSDHSGTAGDAQGRAVVYQPFTARTIHWNGLFGFGGCQFRSYAVISPERSFDFRAFDVGVMLAMKEVPSADPAAGRPGAGVLIRHQGPTVDYAVVAWWDQQNELPVRVVVRSATGWRPANAHESFCVWDLEILWHERNAWLETALRGLPINVGVERYLRADPILKDSER
jgi:hypothetical protein